MMAPLFARSFNSQARAGRPTLFVTLIPNLILGPIVGLLTLGLSACTPPGALSDPGMTQDVMTLPADFNITDLPDGWMLSGDAALGQISPSIVDPRHEFKITSSATGFALTRKTDARLPVMPFLSWRWNPIPGDWTYHPVRLLVGFNEGGKHPAKHTGLARLFPGLSLPPHDRTLSIVWGPSALQRGNLIHLKGKKSGPKEAYYTVRGGPENTGRWWSETVDLSRLYAKAWPNDNVHGAKIVFVGIGVAGSRHPRTSLIGDIRLSR